MNKPLTFLSVEIEYMRVRWFSIGFISGFAAALLMMGFLHG